LPFDTIVVIAPGSMYATSSRQASSCLTALTAAAGGAAALNVPMTAIPVLCALNPSECAPTSDRVVPPYRPSKICP
jgi:hypothetical protein